jgi:hypothetical protein
MVFKIQNEYIFKLKLRAYDGLYTRYQVKQIFSFASKELTGAVSSEKHYSKLLGFPEEEDIYGNYMYFS